jgi:hypothetical protein
MSESSIYTRAERNQAVNLAALLGWSAVAGPLAFTTFNPLLWAYSALIGLPMSFALCWLVGAPVLTWIMRGKVSFFAAGGWGATVAAVIYVLYLGVFVFVYGGSGRAGYPDLGSRFEDSNHVVTVSYWLAQTIPFFLFGLLGAMIGIAVRWAIGPGSSED